MRRIHKVVLYALLGLVGLSLLLPGLLELLRPEPGSAGVRLLTTEAKNQFRALQAMMAGLGVVALWACVDLERSHWLVRGLGLILALAAAARGYSLLVDGMPGLSSLLYLAVEALLAALFLLWPPPPNGGPT